MSAAVCRVPGCEATLYDRNRSGVCRTHNHAEGYCQCIQCTGVVPEYRVKTTADLVAEGLLPGPAMRRKKVSLAVPPWDPAA